MFTRQKPRNLIQNKKSFLKQSCQFSLQKWSLKSSQTSSKNRQRPKITVQDIFTEFLSNMDNPWAVDSLQKFNYYCCPECEIKCQAKQEFIKHAFEHHPSGAIALYGIKDSDVEFPETLKKEEIKDENEQEDLEDQVVQNLDFGIIPDEDDDDYENIIADENVINTNEEDEDFKGKVTNHILISHFFGKNFVKANVFTKRSY